MAICSNAPHAAAAALLVAVAAAFGWAAVAAPTPYWGPGPHPVAHRTVRFARTGVAVNNYDVRERSFDAEVFYPAAGRGSDAVAPGRFPAVSWAIGWASWTERYLETVTNLASHGLIVVATRSADRYIIPAFDKFASDMIDTLTYIEREGTTPGGFLEGHVLLDDAGRVVAGVGGHSSGGGVAIRAAAEAGPGLVKACAALGVAQIAFTFSRENTRDTTWNFRRGTDGVYHGWSGYREVFRSPLTLVAGDEDRTTPVEELLPMFETGVAPRIMPVLAGGSHCWIEPPWGEPDSECGIASRRHARGLNAMEPFQQLNVTRAHMVAFFRLYLAGDLGAAPYVWGDGIRGDGNFSKVYMTPMASVQLMPPRGGRESAPVVPAGGELTLEGYVFNERQEPVAFEVTATPDHAPPPSLSVQLLSEPRTPALGTADGAPLLIHVSAPPPAANASTYCEGGKPSCFRSVTVAARSLLDGGTTVYRSVTVALGAPRDCAVGAWGAWGSCDVTCGRGTQNRTRGVVTPPAGDGAAPCGGLVQERACELEPCPRQGLFRGG